MAGLPRSQSTMSADINVNGSHMPSLPVQKSSVMQSNGRADSVQSPLKLFGHAKKKINEAFKETSSFLHEALDFATSCPDHFDEGYVSKLEAYCDKVKAISDVISRNQMKVVFFGRYVLPFHITFTQFVYTFL